MPGQSLADHFTRYVINLPFRYRRAAETAYHPEVGWTRDLSGRGAWVELPETVAPSTRLDIALRTPQGDLRLGGQVVWVCPEPHDRLHLHGLAFSWATPEQRDRLRGLFAGAKPRGAGRLYCALAGTCQRKGVACGALPCETRDLSPSGLALRLSERVPPGTQLRVSVPTACGRVTADAQVVWAEQAGSRPRGAPYRHGLRFLRLDPSSELPLRALLDGLC
jgi:hypothetical protein